MNCSHQTHRNMYTWMAIVALAFAAMAALVDRYHPSREQLHIAAGQEASFHSLQRGDLLVALVSDENGQTKTSGPISIVVNNGAHLTYQNLGASRETVEHDRAGLHFVPLLQGDARYGCALEKYARGEPFGTGCPEH
jgi:hypothetical protein